MTNIAPELPIKDPQPDRDGLRHVGWTWTVTTKNQGETYTVRVFSHSPSVQYGSVPVYAEPEPQG